MELTAHSTAQGFLDVARPLLEEYERSNGLMLAIGLQLLETPSDGAYLATVSDSGDLVLAAAMTPPHSIVVFSPVPSPAIDAIRVLCGHLSASQIPIPGVLGAAELSALFQREWVRVVPTSSSKATSQRIYELREVRSEVITADGHFRLATEDDVDTLSTWHGEGMRPSLLKLSQTGQIGLWELDAPVSCAAQTRRTPHGGAINLVFTPPPLRRQGYATACVANLCQHLLSSGWQFCCLHADLANPTSNSIYQKIGFTPVIDFQEYRFEELPNKRIHQTPGGAGDP